jgi:hypothetical protein
MRKVSILLVVALIATSCAVGTYHPYAQNNFGAQSTVVLDKANFRVVRDVEAIVDVNNTNLSRADVASSAYGELLRKAQLTGSQVLINVVIEEVRRETAGFFRLLFGMPKRVQHVAARATIIEFLDENGNPRVSESYRPTNTHTTTVTAKPTNNSNASVAAQEVETPTHQPAQQMASVEDLQKCEQVHKQIVRLASHYPTNNVFYKYENLYKKLPKTDENIHKIQKMQLVVSSYFNTNGSAQPYLAKQLRNATSMEEEIAIFLSYYKE